MKGIGESGVAPSWRIVQRDRERLPELELHVAELPLTPAASGGRFGTRSVQRQSGDLDAPREFEFHAHDSR